MPDAPVAAPLVPNGPPPNAVDPRASQRPAWADKADADRAAAKERLGLSGNSSFLDRVMGQKTPGVEPGKEAPKTQDKSIDTRGTKVLGKDQQDKVDKKVEIKDTGVPEKQSSEEAIESLLKGEIEASDLKKEDKSKETAKDAPEGSETQKEGVQDKKDLNAQQDKGTEREKYKWGELKGKAEKFDELEPKYKELEAKLKEFETKAGGSEELQKKLEAKEQELLQTKKELAGWDIQTDDEFRELVIQPIDANYAILEGLAKEYKLDMSAIEKAIELPEKVARNRAFAKILAESEEPIDSVSQADASRAASEIFELREKGSFLQKHALEFREGRKIEKEKFQNEEAVLKQKDFADKAKITFDRMQKAIPFLKDNPAEAKALFESITPEDILKAPPTMQAYNGYSGLLVTKLVPYYKKEMATKDGKISELENRIKELTNGGPSINDDSPRSENTNTNPNMRPDGVSMADWLLRR